MRSVPVVLAVLAMATAASAQEREIEASGLPQPMVDRLIQVVNDPATVRFEGPTHLPADSLVSADIVVMGSLRLAGRVEGDVVVVGGDVDLEPGFHVGGDLAVVDGELRGDELGWIGGLAAQFSRRVPRGTPGARGAPEERGVSVPISRDASRGASSHFAVRAGDFNRVEGLPVLVGPTFTTGGENPFRTEAFLIWRSQRDIPFGTHRTGYRVRMEQFVGGRREWRLGGGVHSVIDPIEGWGLSDRENAWSTFLFTADHRDHFERRGWTAFARATPRGLPLDLDVEFRNEDHGVVAPTDPWSLFSGDRGWRDQPLVAEGSLRSVRGQVTLDTRDGRREPSDGWLVRGVWHQGLGGSLAMPVVGALGEAASESLTSSVLPEVDSRFSRAFLDVRRYNAVGSGARFNLRGVVGGTTGDGLLPPQYQHALGGIGTLPGHPRFAADCGARDALVTLEREGVERPMFPFYGCDRFALVQAEYRGRLDLRFGFGEPGEFGARSPGHRGRPNWVAFFNGGRAWSSGDWGEVPRPDSGARYDAGLGLLLGDAGIYWAAPVGEGARGSRFFVRLERRF